MENENQIKDNIEKLIYHIEQLNSVQKKFDCMFTSYRYKAELDELVLDSLARYLCFCTSDTPNGKKCYSFIMISENTNERKKLNKIIASGNHIDTTALKENIIDIFKIISEQDEKLEQNLFSKLLKQSTSIIKEKIDEVVSNLKNCTREQLNNLRGNHPNIFKPKKKEIYLINDLLGALKSAFQLSDHATDKKKLFSDILWLLNIKMDIYLISLFNDIYEIGFGDDNDYCHIAQGFNQIIDEKNEKKFIHSESKLAMFYLTTNYFNIGQYIGISKLCCPFCARFLRDLKFRFRGNHCCFEKSRQNWTIAMSEESVIDSQKSLMLDGLNNCNKFIIDLQRHSNEEKNKISSKIEISSLLKFNVNEFILEEELYNYGLKSKNRSYDFKSLNDLYKIDKNKNILTYYFENIFNFYSELKNKMNILFLDECKVSKFILVILKY